MHRERRHGVLVLAVGIACHLTSIAFIVAFVVALTHDEGTRYATWFLVLTWATIALGWACLITLIVDLFRLHRFSERGRVLWLLALLSVALVAMPLYWWLHYRWNPPPEAADHRSQSTALLPAGWYADPTGPKDTLRYWDGTAWTEHRAHRADC